MSRNKFILIALILVGIYFALPDQGVYHVIKVNVIAILPYLMVAIIIYLITTIQLLKRAWKRLDADLTDDNTLKFAKLLNISFDVVRILGKPNLIALYKKVSFAKKVSLSAKKTLYNSMRRKRLDVPPPGVHNLDKIKKKKK